MISTKNRPKESSILKNGDHSIFLLIGYDRFERIKFLIMQKLKARVLDYPKYLSNEGFENRKRESQSVIKIRPNRNE